MRDQGGCTRRRLIQGLAMSLLPAAFSSSRTAASGGDGLQPAAARTPYSDAILPRGVRSRFADNGNGITMHVLEAGFEPKGRPAVVLVHGFPELAYSWRKVMP